MDIADITSENDFTEEALARQRAVKMEPVARGNCLNCGEKVKDLFCDEDCQEDHERTQEIKQRLGR
jgi:transcription initiation factor IIE alpha subunit